MLPNEKLLTSGVQSLSSSELIAVVLGSGTRGKSVFQLSDEIAAYPNFHQQLLDMSLNDWAKIHGIGKRKAARIVASIELSRRLFFPDPKVEKIQTASDVYKYCCRWIAGRKTEAFFVLCLDNKNRILHFDLVHEGGFDFVITDMKKIFSTVLRSSARSFICVHNHPSGDPEPSREDQELTQKMIAAARVLDLQFLDHVIVSTERFYSFQERSPHLFRMEGRMEFNKGKMSVTF